MEEEFELEESPLSQKISASGKTVDVQIYRGGGSDWHLEVVDEFANSTVWDDQFKSDQEALDEANDPEQLAFDLAWIKGFFPTHTTHDWRPKSADIRSGS